MITKFPEQDRNEITFTSEEWREAAAHLAHAADILGNVLLKINHEGRGQQDKDEFLTDMTMAVIAMRYIADQGIKVTVGYMTEKN